MAAGGTAGHLVPALAVADALRDRGAEVSFIGAGRDLEKELVPARGYALDNADLRGLQRSLSLRTFLFVWSMFKGTAQCLEVMRRRRPDAVMGGGGYVSWAPVVAARLTRRPALIMELDSHMGLANRALVPLASRVALCFDIPGRSGGKYFRTGRPLGSKLLEATPESGRRHFGLAPGKPLVLVYGGSLGARSINDACAGAFGSGALDFQVLHVSGRRDHELVAARLKEQGADLANYHLLDYTDDLPLALAAADLVVARSGASVQEIAALGKPALLVPYPYATAQHQLRNAEWMAGAGAAAIIPDEELDAERLKEEVAALLADPERLAAMSRASASLGERGGADRVARELLELARRHKSRRR
ncbi:MAG: UDP-N-acetylglucosamine--N-acetylmuramyl-(pentapeptide) pyrophosphoryl-undecaprenol N-acetylglucosamine transferase [Pseudomonadota bacterium]